MRPLLLFFGETSMSRATLFIFLLHGLLIPLHAQSETTPLPLSPKDIVYRKSASSWRLSSDGLKLLWMQSSASKEKDRRVSTLMLSELPEGKARALTVGQEGISQPRFSPKGSRIAFLSSRPFPSGQKALPKDQRGSQVWVLPLNGGEARPITKIPFGVGAFQWLDEKTLLLSARDPKSRQERKAKKDTSQPVEDEALFLDRGRRLFRYGIAGRKLSRITQDRHPVNSFRASPDGRWVIVVHSQSPHFTAEERHPPKSYLYDLKDGSRREFFGERRSKARSYQWRRDSSAFYAIVPHASVDGEGNGAIAQLKLVSADDLSVEHIPLSWEWGLSRPFQVLDDGFVCGLCSGVRPRLARYTQDPCGRWKRSFIRSPNGKTIFGFVAAKNSPQVIFIEGGASDPDHVLGAQLSGSTLLESKEIHRPGGGFKDKALARSEILHWTGSQGERVEGILYHPLGKAPKERRPLILITHGGPHGADHDRFSERWANTPNLYTQRGAYVLKTNYHGSSDYGLRFGESIKSHYYELEIRDLLSGIDLLVKRGLADPERLGLIGWSNGAILSIAAITHQHLYAPEYNYHFKVCCPGAGDVNWTSDYGNCAFGPSFDDYYLGGAPWDLPALYLEKSPLFQVKRMDAPTLIFFGTKDRSVPTEQGWQWYRALHRSTQTPVRFVLFPGEPHGLQKLSHRMRKLEEELAWVDRYLFAKTPSSESLIKKGSPLDIAQRMQRIPRLGQHFGTVIKGRLIPECVPWGKIEVSRFELTRAQWRAFRNEGPDRSGGGNLPKVGLSAKEVNDYISWLAHLSGRKVRLLRESEFRKLSKLDGGRENTLALWAGYTPPPNEAKLLGKRIAKLGVRRVLRRAGATPPALHRFGDRLSLLYDLGGNAAEWVMGPKGKAVRRGICPLTPPGPEAGSEDAPAAWTGLRIAIDP